MYYKMIQGEMFYGKEVIGGNYTLTPKDTSKVVDGWVWYDKPPIAEVTLPCGCCVKMLIDPKVETTETAQAEVDVITAKVVEGKAQTLSVSAVAVDPVVAEEEGAIIG